MAKANNPPNRKDATKAAAALGIKLAQAVKNGDEEAAARLAEQVRLAQELLENGPKE